MKRIVVTYGVISGVIVICSIMLSLSLSDNEQSWINLEYLGYLIMLVALSVIFVAIKRYRDQELGGVITFGTAVMIGLGISVVAGVVYVAIWEFYLAQTNYAFIDDYVDSVIAAKEAEGIVAAELENIVTDMETLRRQYAKPAFRLPMTFLEIFPVGLLITLISAAILRKKENRPVATGSDAN